MGWDDRCEVGELVGVTLRAIMGMEDGSDDVLFRSADGSGFHMFHSRVCCETVDLVEVIGDPSDLIGTPILAADELSSDGAEPVDAESYTWTFYRFTTIKGSVVLRWLGQSNGCYSERAAFERVSKDEMEAV